MQISLRTIFARSCHFVSLIGLVSFGQQVQSQPIDKVWKRLVFLRDSATGVSVSSQLTELTAYEKALKSEPADPDSTDALLMERIGVLYFRQSDYGKAIAYTRRSVDYSAPHQQRVLTDAKILLDDYTNLAYYYADTKDFAERGRSIDSSISIGLRCHIWNDRLEYYLAERTNEVLESGDYENCIARANQGKNITRLFYHGADSPQYSMRFVIAEINALLQLGNYIQAENLVDAAFKSLSKGSRDLFAAPLYILKAKALEGQKLFDQGLLCLEESFRLNQKVGYKAGCGQSLAEMGFLYLNGLANLNQALLNFKKALWYTDASDSLFIWNKMANIYARQGLYNQAQGAFRQAFAQIRAGADESTLLSIPLGETSHSLIAYVSDLILDKADMYRRAYAADKQDTDLQKAIELYKTADLFFDKLRTEQEDIKSMLFWRKDNRRLYEQAIAACYSNQDLKDAFYFFEKSRAVLLNDELSTENFSNDSDIVRQAGTKLRINEVEKEMKAVQPSSSEELKLQSELIRLNQQLSDGVGEIKIHRPLYYQSFLDTHFISMEEVRKYILKDQDLLLELLQADSAVYLFGISSQHIDFVKVDKKAYDSLTGLFISYISSPSLLNRHFDSYIRVASQLYQLIFTHCRLGTGKIILCTDGYNFPFEALVTSGNKEPVSYLIEKHPISYTYSARFLLNPFSGTVPNHDSRNFLGIAPVEYDNRLKLSTLPGSDHSIQRICSGFDQSDIYLGPDASLGHFLANFYKYRIIQLYTHGKANGENSEPVIYFADSSLSMSGLITAQKPSTRLVVLSACETGLGKLYSGEGIFSFSRRFAGLGIPSSVGNLWSVDNQSTYKLTELFYKYLSSGIPIDIALQKAKIEFIQTSNKEKKLPYYWASPVLVGKTEAIRPASRSIMGWILLGAWMIILIFAGLQWMARALKISGKGRRL